MGAELQGADLTGADLTEAVMYGAGYDASTRWPANIDPRRIGAVMDKSS